MTTGEKAAITAIIGVSSFVATTATFGLFGAMLYKGKRPKGTRSPWAAGAAVGVLSGTVAACGVLFGTPALLAKKQAVTP